MQTLLGYDLSRGAFVFISLAVEQAMGNESNVVYPRWQIVILAGMIVGFLLVGIWFFKGQYDRQRKEVEAHLRSIGTLKARQIADWRSERVADAAVLMERLHLSASVERFLSSSDEREASEILRRLRTVKERYHYADIILVDLEMKPRLSLYPGVMNTHKGYIPYIRTAIAERMPAWTPIVVEPDYPVSHLSLVVPLFSKDDGNTPIGVLIMVCDATEYLFPLIQSWPTPSRTAETLLVRKIGEEVLFLNELRHREIAASLLRIPLSRADLPAAKAVSGEEGVVMGRDYRGVEVVSFIIPIADSPWFMVAKIDRAEAFAEWHTRSMLLLLLMLVTTGLVVVIGIVLRQRLLKARYRELYQAETALSNVLERQAITLKSIGDAVIATDSEGRVELMNPVAERLTGWRFEEASGRPVTGVFKIISEGERGRVADPVLRVLKEGVVVGLANHTLLIAKDGREIPIADSCAPIKGKSGETIGVVLVFKDQTKERENQGALEESERKYRLLSDNSLDAIWTMNLELEFTYISPAVETIIGYTPEEWIGSRLPEHCDEENFAKMAQMIGEEMAKGQEGSGVVFEAVMLNKGGDPIPVEIWGKIIYDENGEPAGLQGATRDITERKRAEKDQRELQEQLHQAQKIESVGRLAGGVAHDYNNILGVIIGYTELSLADVAQTDRIYHNLQEVLKAAYRSRDVTRQLLAFARKEVITPEVLDLNATVESMLNMIQRLIGENIKLVWRPGEDIWPVKMDPSQINQVLANLCLNARDAISNVGTISIETDKNCIDEAYRAHHREVVPGDYVILAVSDDGAGMDKDTQDMIFEPFFTTKEVGKGTGLGLSTVFGIVKQNNGFIYVYSELGKGTTLRIYLPRYRGRIVEDQKEDVAEAPRAKGETVLVVEDESSILHLAEIILKRLGYTVVLADHPAEALRLAKAHDGDISLLITDVIMPGMDGRALTEKLQSLYPGIRCLYMSGYTADVIAQSGVLDPGIHFIQKPFNQRDLALKIREVLDG